MPGDEVQQFSVGALFDGGADYLIPMYQRNYAWDEGEITQLIQDVIDYLPRGQNYYIGTLVVDARRPGARPVYETIDGQQRLTTLALLAAYLQKEGVLSWRGEPSLRFESREHSRATLAAIFKGNFEDDPSEVLGRQEMNTAILNGYRLIKKILPQKLGEKPRNGQQYSLAQFAGFLMERVQVMRVQVPPQTDLNHYFEIMNNRGEQLEKHEVLKAKLMGRFEDADPAEREACRRCLQTVWEACANMEQYVQMGFTVAQRRRIFDPAGEAVELRDFEALRNTLSGSGDDGSDEGTESSLDQLIAAAGQNRAGKDARSEEPDERFSTIINFPNFLLHVLRMQYGPGVPLDDKQLLEAFDSTVGKSADAVAAVKTFTVNLLRCKHLYDHHVIKREMVKETADRWSLKRFKFNSASAGNPSGHNYVNTFGPEDENAGVQRQILMLQAALHVSAPTAVYKHWLNAALHWLFHQGEAIRAENYLGHLESVARAFVFDRFLAPSGGLDYEEMIYTHGAKCQSDRADFSAEGMRERLSFGKIQNNLVFNYLDYLLWCDHEKSAGKDDRIRSYEFTFRSSVEHYYPQHPKSGPTLAPAITDSFGNLCLISHSRNSALSNYSPEAKKQHYANHPIDSIKQHLMMQPRTEWNEANIARHYEEMTAVLLGSLKDKPQTAAA